MLMVIMYHHVNSDDRALSNDPETLAAHFAYIKEHYNVVWPGDTLSKTKRNVCLTFDDAYYDFRHYVYPLLERYDLKAVIAVPAHYILDHTDLDAQTRLSLTHRAIYEGEHYRTHAPFCTYEELSLMHERVRVASHGFHHLNLSEPGCDLEQEIVASKQRLEAKLGISVDTFILPYGKYTPEVTRLCREHYPYVMRIGNAFNRDFSGIGGLIYRVKGDALTSATALFGWRATLRFRFKQFIKSLKG